MIGSGRRIRIRVFTNCDIVGRCTELQQRIGRDRTERIVGHKALVMGLCKGRNLLDASKTSTDTDGSAHIAASTPFKEHLEFKQTVDPLARCDRDLALLRNPCHLIKVVRTDGILKEHRSVRLKPRAELYGKPRLQTAV